MRLPWADGPFVVPEGTPGAITIIGRVYDGAGNIIPDGLIETWQADPDGRFAHPDDPRGADARRVPGFRGFGRCPTALRRLVQHRHAQAGAAADPDGGIEAPHLDVSVFARGLLDRVVTRIYFPDEADRQRRRPGAVLHRRPGAAGHAHRGARAGRAAPVRHPAAG